MSATTRPPGNRSSKRPCSFTSTRPSRSVMAVSALFLAGSLASLVRGERPRSAALAERNRSSSSSGLPSRSSTCTRRPSTSKVSGRRLPVATRQGGRLALIVCAATTSVPSRRTMRKPSMRRSPKGETLMLVVWSVRPAPSAKRRRRDSTKPPAQIEPPIAAHTPTTTTIAAMMPIRRPTLTGSLATTRRSGIRSSLSEPTWRGHARCAGRRVLDQRRWLCKRSDAGSRDAERLLSPLWQPRGSRPRLRRPAEWPLRAPAARSRRPRSRRCPALARLRFPSLSGRL